MRTRPDNAGFGCINALLLSAVFWLTLWLIVNHFR